jgi:dolichol-phosphate mannosyltransferase
MRERVMAPNGASAVTTVSVIVPTFNEAPNVAPLLDRLVEATDGTVVEVIFVDDSPDDTPQVIAAESASRNLPVRLIHRDVPEGGLGGAVLEGLQAASSDWCVVMDGDLQHPPEVIPALVSRAARGGLDVVVGSRYAAGGASGGLSSWFRHVVSRTSTLVTRAMFPRRLRSCTDPMTGYFLIHRTAVDLDTLKPRGFKILLEILARQQLRVAEVPFTFADRHAGESKASLAQGWWFLTQLTALRFGRMSGFAIVGAVGAVVNVAIVWLLTALGVEYLVAAVIAAEGTIVGNFLVIDGVVFRDLKAEAGGFSHRFARSFAFNNIEAVVRIPVVALMVESWHFSSVAATALTLVIAFFARFIFHSLVVYRPQRPAVSEAAAAAAARPLLGVIEASNDREPARVR